MQQVQEKLEFAIELPSDEELVERFSSRQGGISKRLTAPNVSRNQRKRQRKKARQHN